MKGTFFQKGCEYRLQTEGETWVQGETIGGHLIVRAHAPATAPEKARVVLAHGGLKAVHAKSPDAFDVVAEAEVGGPGLVSESGAPWSVATGSNAPITDSTSSLFLLYGPADGGLETLGRLQVTLKPNPVIAKFLDVLQTRFRFVLKANRSEKKGMQSKLVPPDSQALSFVEQLVLRFAFEGETLGVTYEFTTHSFEASASSVNAKKAKKIREIDFTPTDYKLSSGRLNDDLFENHIRGALDEIAR